MSSAMGSLTTHMHANFRIDSKLLQQFTNDSDTASLPWHY